jgi:Outer membrane protein beta-barrel domain
MRKFYVLMTGLCMALSTMAQTDTTNAGKNPDTIRIGSLIIVKKGDGHYENKDGSVHVYHHRQRNENVSTNWFIFDIGFANYTDKTNYAGAAAQQFSPGSTKDRFDLRTGKSINVNLWFFMQRLNVVKHVVNLKYGLGLELNNYRYDANVFYKKSPVMVIDTALHFKKNKLAADYLTIPLMLNFNFTPGNDNNKTFGLSAGVSAGYLYSSRQKYISRETGKEKTKGDLGLEPFKISYIAELQLGPIKLYGSMATKSMFKKGLDQTPFNVGFRLSNW